MLKKNTIMNDCGGDRNDSVESIVIMAIQIVDAYEDAIYNCRSTCVCEMKWKY